MSRALDLGTEDAGEPEPGMPAASRSRRAIMTGTMAAGAGIATAMLLSAQPAQAADGDQVLLGEANVASSTTSITNDGESSSSGDGLDVSAAQGNGVTGTTSAGGMSGLAGVDTSSTGGVGVSGTSTNGIGVHGSSDIGPGVSGTAPNGPGVVGTSTNNFGVSGSSQISAGVYGTTTNEAQSGVWGEDGTVSPAAGVGVSGTSTNGIGVHGDSTSGTGVSASSSAGTALLVEGIARFSRSGVATVPAGRSQVTVTLAGVSAQSMVLATKQSLTTFPPGAASWVLAAVPGAGSFTIYMSAATKQNAAVAWLVLDAVGG